LKCWVERRCHNQQKKFPKFKLYYSGRAAKHTYQCYFDKQTIFKDSLFYDISAWSFDLAFNLNFEGLNSLLLLGKIPNGKTGVVSKKSNMVI
jgi:hypothetical protein